MEKSEEPWRFQRAIGPTANVCSCETLLQENISFGYSKVGGTAVAQWLRCCATNRKAAGSIPAGVSGIFH